MTIIQNPSKMDEELYKSILNLLQQLNIQHPLPTFSEIKNLLESNTSKLFVARYPLITSPIAGMLTLAIFRVPSGVRAHIEDVIVNHELRNKGIAKALMSTALQSALVEGANGVSLTSNPSRLAANKLYESLGFKRWDTNIYFINLN